MRVIKRVLLASVVGFIFFSCSDNKASKNKLEEYEMYTPSEMAILMNEMYQHNLKIKQVILNGEALAEFPEEFLKIHTAQLSDFKERNETFEAFSKVFITAEKEIFNSHSNQPLKERYNNAVNVCISCHQTECTGPITRIKKLLIKEE